MAEPVVSIIGRPNVGKSTLFNRIIRKREAIVDDMPGVTRDRKHARASWENVNFTLVDTGGFIPKTRDVMEAGVTRQVRLAIEEADVIIFLVDVTTGITDVDGEVARLLRKSGKPCLVAVNKVDNLSREPEASSFIRLGLGDPVVISAMRGRGVGDLLSAVVEKIEPEKELDQPSAEDTAVHLAVVGKPNGGKSTFINRILGEERLLVTEIPGTTRDPVDIRVRHKDNEFVLIDTAGMRRRTRIKESVEYYSNLRTHRAIERCHAACIFVSAEEGLTQQDMRVIREVAEARKGILLVVNKWDLVKDDEEMRRHWSDMLDLKMQGLDYVPVIRVSCKTGLRVERVLVMVWRIAQERKKRVPSPKLNELLADMNRKVQHPAVQGKRIRILYGSQVGIEPPKFVFFATHPYLLKESYKRFLENQIRENFGFEGVPVSFVFKRKNK
jgi:GTP-binding protein